MNRQHKLALSIIGIAIVIAGLAFFTPAIRQACAATGGDEQPICNNNGSCDTGETHDNCPADCQASTPPPPPPAPGRCPGSSGPAPDHVKCGANQCSTNKDCCDIQNGWPTDDYNNRCIGAECGMNGTGAGGSNQPTCYNDHTDPCSNPADTYHYKNCQSCMTNNPGMPRCVVNEGQCTLGTKCTTGGVTCCAVGTHPTGSPPDMTPGDFMNWCKQQKALGNNPSSCGSVCPAGNTTPECKCMNGDTASCNEACNKWPGSGGCTPPASKGGAAVVFLLNILGHK